MENDLTNEQKSDIQKQLDDTKKELNELRQKQNTQNIFIETLLDKGGKIFMSYLQMSSQENRYTLDKENELEKEELSIISKLDTKEKIYKGVMIGICLIALILSAIFIEKAEVVIPVLSLIIGLLFKSNSLSEYFSHAKRKFKDKEEE